MTRPNQYMIPTSPHEITIKEVFQWLLDVEPLKPTAINELQELKTDKERLSSIEDWTDGFIGKELRPYLEANVCFWSGVSKDVAKSFVLPELLEIYEDTKRAMYGSTLYKYKEVLKIKGVLYSLPAPNMRGSILFQYAEADQEESNLLKNKQNLFYLMPDLMALLLRQDQEPLFMSDKQIKERTEAFKEATMNQAWQVFKYFQSTKEEVEKVFGKTLFSTPSNAERKAGVKGLQDSFGWLLTIKRLAEKKIFDLDGLDSQDSVLNTNTWECLTHLSVDNAIGAYQERLYKQD